MCISVVIDDEALCDTCGELGKALEVDLDMIPTLHGFETPSDDECLCNVNFDAIEHLFGMRSSMDEMAMHIRLTTVSKPTERGGE